MAFTISPMHERERRPSIRQTSVGSLVIPNMYISLHAPVGCSLAIFPSLLLVQSLLKLYPLIIFRNGSFSVGGYLSNPSMALLQSYHNTSVRLAWAKGFAARMLPPFRGLHPTLPTFVGGFVYSPLKLTIRLGNSIHLRSRTQ